MMESRAQVSELAQRFLVERPKELERASGFVQRSTAQLDGPKFVQMCVLGWMNNASASSSQLNHVVASLDLHVRNQAIEERFGPAGSSLVRRLLEEATGQLLQGRAVETPLFEHFAGGVFLQDGSVVSLPNELSTSWRGSGGRSGAGESGVRIQARWEMRGGGLHGLWMQDARMPVRLIARRLPNEVIQRRKKRAKREVERRPRSKGVQRCGRRPKRGSGSQPRKRAGTRHKTSASKQRQVEWLLVLTNVESQVLSAEQVVALMRLRWQIELLWKLWKQEGKIDTWRSSKPQRILTELYAKLLGLLLEHWVTLQGCWSDPRRSLVKARQVIQWTVSWLVLAIRGEVAWEVVLSGMCSSMGSNCWTDKRQHPPSTFQQLDDPKLCGS